jgi:hypothetical protein
MCARPPVGSIRPPLSPVSPVGRQKRQSPPEKPAQTTPSHVDQAEHLDPIHGDPGPRKLGDHHLPAGRKRACDLIDDPAPPRSMTNVCESLTARYASGLLTWGSRFFPATSRRRKRLLPIGRPQSRNGGQLSRRPESERSEPARLWQNYKIAAVRLATRCLREWPHWVPHRPNRKPHRSGTSLQLITEAPPRLASTVRVGRRVEPDDVSTSHRPAAAASNAS